MSWWRRRKRGQRLSLILFIGLPIIGYVILNPHGVIQRVRLELAKQEMQEKVRKEELERLHLEDLSRRLETDKRTIEKIAREKYGMVREGETIYKVKPKR